MFIYHKNMTKNNEHMYLRNVQAFQAFETPLHRLPHSSHWIYPEYFYGREDVNKKLSMRELPKYCK